MADRKESRSAPFQGSLAVALLRLTAALPLPLVRALGAFVGHLGALLPNQLRRHARWNVAWCLPDLSARERRRLVRRSLVETGKTLGEAGAAYLWPVERLRRLEGSVEGEELLDREMAAGRGTLLLVPHLGNWELFNHFLTDRYPFAALYRRPRIRELDPVIREARERTGCEMISATPPGLRRLYRALAESRLVMVLPDQEPIRSSGVFAPFFGVPAFTMTLVARIARRSGAAILFGWTERQKDGRFRYHFQDPPDGLDDPDPVVAATRLNQGIEAVVRACPEQYSWSYPRFKTRPPRELRRLAGRPGAERVWLYTRVRLPDGRRVGPGLWRPEVRRPTT